MSNTTWIVFKANSVSADGWEHRKLMPSGAGTDLLWENWDCSGRIPAVGDRVRDYRQDFPSGEVTHGKDGDWLVTHLEHFSSFDTSYRIVICHCTYQPSSAEWVPISHGVPVTELLQEPA